MRKEQIVIPEGTKYLSEVKGFELPNGIFNKVVTGCGATTVAIVDKYPTIICSPRLALIESKIGQHPNLFWYKYNTSDDELRAYIRDNECPKIMVTFDSLWKLVDRLNVDKFRVVVDEFQRLLTDSSFKSETEFKMIENLQKFPYVTYLSATPILDKYLVQMNIFNDVTYYEAKWSNVKKINMLPYKTPTPERAIIRIIDLYKSGDVKFTLEDGREFESKEAVIYVNSVKTIVNAIKTAKLAPEEVNIIVANNERNDRMIAKIGKDFERGTIPNKGEQHKMFTFCTSTAFDGVDMYSDNAATFVISNYHLDNLLMDIRTDLAQIAGRQRLYSNPLRDTVVFFYNEGFELELVDEYRANIATKLTHTETIVNNRNRLKDRDIDAFNLDMEDWLARNEDDKYIKTYTMVANNQFAVNRLLYLNEQYKIDLCVDFAKNGINILMDNLENYDKVHNPKYISFKETIEYTIIDTMFEDKMENYCYLMDNGLEVPELYDREGNRYDDIYRALGTERCRANGFRKNRLMKEFNNLKAITLSKEDMVTEIRNEFPEEGMVGKDVKKYLQDKFDKYGVKSKAKSTSLQELIPAFRTNVTVNGKRKSGWKLEIHR